MRFSEAQGHKVVSTTTAETLGQIDGFVVDPADRSVVALELRSRQDGDIVRWTAIRSFGADAVTVDSPDALTTADEPVAALRGKAHELLGKRVLTTEGDERGAVVDVDFDTDTGAVVRLLLGDQGAHVPGSRLIGVGSYAVVVRVE